MTDSSACCQLQVLQWTLQSARAAWAQPEVAASLASPAAFFSRYIALQPDAAGGLVVREQALFFHHLALAAMSSPGQCTAGLDHLLAATLHVPDASVSRDPHFAAPDCHSCTSEGWRPRPTAGHVPRDAHHRAVAT